MRPANESYHTPAIKLTAKALDLLNKQVSPYLPIRVRIPLIVQST
jgi:hypothetical protein